MYDWANSAMLAVVVTAVFPIFYSRVASDGLSPETATRNFTLTTTLCMLVAALLSPILGALADIGARKKRFLAVFLCLGASATAAMFFIERGDWLLASLLFGLANVGATASFVFYDSLLPHVARADELDVVSTSGYALGYVGGGLFLAGVVFVLGSPQTFGLPAADQDVNALTVRVCFVAVALWWVLFSLPLFRKVGEPPRRLEADESEGATRGWSGVRLACTRLAETGRELSRYSQAMLMLGAFLAYNDGIGTIIRMSGVYGKELGMPDETLLGAFLLVQFLGVPCSFGFGALAQRFGAKRLVLISIAVYAVTSLLAWQMREPWHFWVLAILVGLVQGGSQALSRSLFASLIPRHKSGEFFGLFAVLEKFAGVLGPALFWVTATLTGSSRHGILSVVVFFVVGAILLLRVDVEAGRRAAAAAESGLRDPTP